MDDARPEKPPADPSKDPTPTDDTRARQALLQIWGPVIVLALLAFGYTVTKLEPPAPRHLTLAAGAPDGAYFEVASQYRDYLAQHGFELEVLETAGSMENLRLLKAGDADLALLQGGVTDPVASPHLESLGSLFLEPIWLFHRSATPIETFHDLEALRISMGREGSGTRALVQPLLTENGLEGKYEEVSLGSSEAAAALQAGQIDAAFFVASARAAYVERLLSAEDIELFSLRRYRAFQVRYPFLSRVILGEGVVDMNVNLPAQDVSLMAAAATLAARDDLHHALVPVLIETLSEVHGPGGIFEKHGAFPSTGLVDLPIKKEAVHYIENGPSFLYRILPYRTAATVDRLKILLLPFIPLLLVVFKMAPPLYRWRIRSKIFRWYEDLRELDLMVLSGPPKSQIGAALEKVEKLENEVLEVQVPLSYMDEFYNLRVHIELIETKLRELERKL